MYPLNMTLAAGIGFAVANDEAEHQALTDAGYLPAIVAPVAVEVEAVADTPAEATKRGPGRPRKAD